MLDSLGHFGFNVFFGYIGLVLIAIPILWILSVIVSLFESSSSITIKEEIKPKVKEKNAWQLQWEKVRSEPITVLKDMGIATLFLLGGCILLALVNLIIKL